MYVAYMKLKIINVDFVKGKIIINFMLSKTGNDVYFLLPESFFKKTVCTISGLILRAICTKLSFGAFNNCCIFDFFETDFPKKRSFLSFPILKDCKSLRLIGYAEPPESPLFFMLK